MAEKTFKEIFDEFSKKMLDLDPENELDRYWSRIHNQALNEPDWESLYYAFPDGVEIRVESECFISTITITDTEGKEHEFITNAKSGNYFDYWMGFNHFESDHALSLKHLISDTDEYFIDRICATYSLKKLQEELTDDVLQKVFKGHNVVSFAYLLANPRKDVVEWALQHKEELGLKKVKRGFIAEYQAIPELKKLILNTLEKKGE